MSAYNFFYIIYLFILIFFIIIVCGTVVAICLVSKVLHRSTKDFKRIFSLVVLQKNLLKKKWKNH